MASKFIIILREGQLTKRTVHKPAAPRKLDKWLRAAGQVAATWGANHFVFRFHGKWHVVRATMWTPNEPLKTFDEQTAAEMYMLTKGLH